MTPLCPSIFIIDIAFCLLILIFGSEQTPPGWKGHQAIHICYGRDIFLLSLVVFPGCRGSFFNTGCLARYGGGGGGRGSSDAIIPALIVNYMPPVVSAFVWLPSWP